MIAELSSKGIVAVRCTRGGRSNVSHAAVWTCLSACVCVCVCVCARARVFRGLVYKSFTYLCIYDMKSFIKYFLRFALHRPTICRVWQWGPKMIWKFKFAKFLKLQGHQIRSNWISLLLDTPIIPLQLSITEKSIADGSPRPPGGPTPSSRWVNIGLSCGISLRRSDGLMRTVTGSYLWLCL